MGQKRSVDDEPLPIGSKQQQHRQQQQQQQLKEELPTLAVPGPLAILFRPA